MKQLPRWFISSLPILRILIFIVVALLATYEGVRLRLWFYPATSDYHYRYDILNAWDQGTNIYVDAVLIQKDNNPPKWGPFLRAYLQRYDKVIDEVPSGQFYLDYPPARLLIMSIWVKLERPNFVPIFSDPASEYFARPLLWINTVAEFLAACLAFLVVRCVLVRQRNRWAIWPALGAALLLWFDPTVLVDHMWPQWDSWCLPFYLLAAFLGLQRRWMLLGVTLGVGMMFKGQLLASASFFALWPLFQGRWLAVLRLIIGAFLGLSICVSPWLIRTPWALVSMIVILAAAIFGARYTPRKWRLMLITASIPISIFFSGWLFKGSFGWWFVPFAYSSHHYMRLIMGTPNNLSALLARRWGWDLLDIAYVGAHLTLTLRATLVTIYCVTLVACAYGLARHDLRNNRRVLLAIATPWLLFFTFLPQLHERYLYWGAALTALAAGVSLGTTLLHLAVTSLASMTMLGFLLRAQNFPFANFVKNTFPDSAWAVILITLIFLYLSIAPGPVCQGNPQANKAPEKTPEPSSPPPQPQTSL